MSTGTYQALQFAADQLRQESINALKTYQPGSELSNQPERAEVLADWQIEKASDQARVANEIKVQELKRLLKEDREAAKQRNIEAVSEFFDRLASGRYVPEVSLEETPKRKYTPRKKSTEALEKRTPMTRRRKREETATIPEMEYANQQHAFYGNAHVPQQQMVPFDQSQMRPGGFFTSQQRTMWPGQDYYDTQPMSFSQSQMHPFENVPYDPQSKMQQYSRKSDSGNAGSSSPTADELVVDVEGLSSPGVEEPFVEYPPSNNFSSSPSQSPQYSNLDVTGLELNDYREESVSEAKVDEELWKTKDNGNWARNFQY